MSTFSAQSLSQAGMDQLRKQRGWWATNSLYWLVGCGLKKPRSTWKSWTKVWQLPTPKHSYNRSHYLDLWACHVQRASIQAQFGHGILEQCFAHRRALCILWNLGWVCPSTCDLWPCHALPTLQGPSVNELEGMSAWKVGDLWRWCWSTHAGIDGFVWPITSLQGPPQYRKFGQEEAFIFMFYLAIVYFLSTIREWEDIKV